MAKIMHKTINMMSKWKTNRIYNNKPQPLTVLINSLFFKAFSYHNPNNLWLASLSHFSLGNLNNFHYINPDCFHGSLRLKFCQLHDLPNKVHMVKSTNISLLTWIISYKTPFQKLNLYTLHLFNLFLNNHSPHIQ